MKTKQKQTPRQPYSFKRYCEYEMFQSLGTSKDFQQTPQQIQTEIIMFPPPREARSKTAFASRGLAFQNIGENIQSKPRLGQRNVHSRQNIQIMNKKLKKLKESIFGSCHLDSTSPDMLKSSEIKLNGHTKIFTHNTEPMTSKRNIYSCAHLRSQYNPQSPRIQQKQQKQKKPKTSQNPRHLKSVQQKLQIKPNSFRATLKQKHIDDNPKVLANIIRKKVQCMNNLQIHQYIHSLMRKGQN